jgi:hypothetical protein
VETILLKQQQRLARMIARSAIPAWPNADPSQSSHGSFEIGPLLVRRQIGWSDMVVGVVGEFVPSGLNGGNFTRERIDCMTRNEEGCRDLILMQQR